MQSKKNPTFLTFLAASTEVCSLFYSEQNAQLTFVNRILSRRGEHVTTVKDHVPTTFQRSIQLWSPLYGGWYTCSCFGGRDDHRRRKSWRGKSPQLNHVPHPLHRCVHDCVHMDRLLHLVLSIPFFDSSLAVHFEGVKSIFSNDYFLCTLILNLLPSTYVYEKIRRRNRATAVNVWKEVEYQKGFPFCTTG